MPPMLLWWLTAVRRLFSPGFGLALLWCYCAEIPVPAAVERRYWFSGLVELSGATYSSNVPALSIAGLLEASVAAARLLTLS